MLRCPGASCDGGARRCDAARAREQRAVPHRHVERDIGDHRQRCAGARDQQAAERRPALERRRAEDQPQRHERGRGHQPDARQLGQERGGGREPEARRHPGREPDAERARDEVEERRRRGGDPGVRVDRAADEGEVRHQRAHEAAGDPRPAVPREQLAQEQRHEQDRDRHEHRRAQPHRVEPVDGVAPGPGGELVGHDERGVVERRVAADARVTAPAAAGRVLIERIA